jgi:hypothetical protein
MVIPATTSAIDHTPPDILSASQDLVWQIMQHKRYFLAHASIDVVNAAPGPFPHSAWDAVLASGDAAAIMAIIYPSFDAAHSLSAPTGVGVYQAYWRLQRPDLSWDRISLDPYATAYGSDLAPFWPRIMAVARDSGFAYSHMLDSIYQLRESLIDWAAVSAGSDLSTLPLIAGEPPPVVHPSIAAAMMDVGSEDTLRCLNDFHSRFWREAALSSWKPLVRSKELSVLLGGDETDFSLVHLADNPYLDAAAVAQIYEWLLLSIAGGSSSRAQGAMALALERHGCPFSGTHKQRILSQHAVVASGPCEAMERAILRFPALVRYQPLLSALLSSGSWAVRRDAILLSAGTTWLPACLALASARDRDCLEELMALSDADNVRGLTSADFVPFVGHESDVVRTNAYRLLSFLPSVAKDTSLSSSLSSSLGSSRGSSRR